jgi:hypothetical protein
MDSWQGRVETHRLAGESNASLGLRQSLSEIITTFLPDSAAATAREKRANERKRRSWIANAATAIGAKYPEEKKNRARFTGESLRTARAAKTGKRRPDRSNAESKEARARARRLKDVLL